MLPNPPDITQLLRSQAEATRDGLLRDYQLATALARLLLKHTGHQPWDAFLRTWHLYLQSIPFDLAREAWGINAAAASLATRTRTR